MNEFITITSLCSLLNTTTRTLWFYEDKKLIHSFRNESNIRCYTYEEAEKIRKILLLRSLNLPLQKIESLLNHRHYEEGLYDEEKKIYTKEYHLLRSYHSLNHLPFDDIKTTKDLLRYIEEENNSRNTSIDFKQKRKLCLDATNELISLQFEAFFSRLIEAFQYFFHLDYISDIICKHSDPSYPNHIIDEFSNEEDYVVIVQLSNEKLFLDYSVLLPDKICAMSYFYME